MRRLFTFGCSYTQYFWPTWADLLGLEYDQHQNWAMQGLGNQAISERLAECHVRNKFTKDDTVIVQWSGHTRHDWYNKEWIKYPRMFPWKTLGSIFNEFNSKLYDEKWIKTFFSESAYFMHTLNFIVLAKGLLDSTGCTWRMTSMGELRSLGSDINYTRESSIDADNAWQQFPQLQIYEQDIWENNLWVEPIAPFCQQYQDRYVTTVNDSNNLIFDNHPSIEHHQLWLNQCLRPKLNLDVIPDSQDLIVDKVKKITTKPRTKDDIVKAIENKSTYFPSNFKWPKNYIGF